MIVIGSNDDVGRRGVQAFMDRFRARGGQVLAALGVADVPGDLGPRLRDADRADAVFLAVRGPTARVLAPQLASLGLSSKPQVGTSQLVLGTGSLRKIRCWMGLFIPLNRGVCRGEVNPVRGGCGGTFAKYAGRGVAAVRVWCRCLEAVCLSREAVCWWCGWRAEWCYRNVTFG